jgi:inhibitor of KinA
MPNPPRLGADDPRSCDVWERSGPSAGHANCDAYRTLPVGDTALVVEFGDSIDRNINAKVLALAQRLSEVRLEGIVEWVPTFRSLLVHYDPDLLSIGSLNTRIAELMQDLQVTERSGRSWRLPVCYDAQLAPDIDEVASRTGLSPAQVVECHSTATYHVYMLGFLPGMAYLGDLPAELVLPRLATPRVRVPAGSLAIATTMTCIIPLETPSGWHLIGRSPVTFLRRQPHIAALLAAGDTIKLMPVSLREFEQLAARAAAGMLHIVPVDETMERAA